MAKILLVEDDPVYSDVVKDFLEREKHLVEVVENGLDALEFLRSCQFDLIILDWNIKGIPGVTVCARYRISGGTTPILMLTGRAEIEDKEQGLDSGADDYLVKTAEMRELAARVRALLRRPAAVSGTLLQTADIVLDTPKGTVSKGGKQLQLFPREFALLEYLLRHKGQVFSPEALLDRVWSSDIEASPHTVRTCVNRLRAKIESPGAAPIIKTIYGFGYKIED